MTLHPNAIGVDISRDYLDVFCSRSRRHWRIANTPEAVAILIETCRDAFLVFEATSGCDHELRRCATASALPFARVNPRQAREFARANGILAKTDRVDARVLAETLASHADPVAALKAYESARLAPTTRIVETNRAHPPDFINIKVEELVGDRPFERLDDYITQDELRALSDNYKRIAGFAVPTGADKPPAA